MLATPHKEVLESLRRLSHDPDMQRVRAFLMKQRDDVLTILASHIDDRLVRQAQGAYQVLDQLVVGTAPSPLPRP